MNKRHISNDKIKSLYKEGGLKEVINYYFNDRDYIFTFENGLASDISILLEKINKKKLNF